jgi:hypothetical protein
MRTGLLLLWLAGCGGDNGASDLGADLGVVLPDLSSPDSGHGGPCTDSADGQPDGAVCVRSVSGATVDENGAALSGVFVTYCAGDCFYGMSGGDGGTFTIDVRAHVVPSDYAVEVHGRPDRISYYVNTPQPANGAIQLAAPLPVPPLPASGPTLLRDGSAQSPSSGDLTLLLAAGTQVTLDPSDLVDITPAADGGAAHPEAGQWRIWRAPDPSKLPFVDPAHPPDVLYALSPFECTFSAKTPLQILNAPAFPAGTVFDVLAQRSLIDQSPPAGALLRVAGAHVSTDGKTIDFDSGDGITLTTWIALVKK